MEKTRIGVIFGGRSSEHDISCIAAPNIIDRIDREQYEVFIFGIIKLHAFFNFFIGTVEGILYKFTVKVA